MRTTPAFPVVAALLLAVAVVAQTPADQKKIEDLRAKRERGEPLTTEDRAFIQRMMALRGQQGSAQKGATTQLDPQRAAQKEKWMKEHPPRESTGMIALTDLGKGAYKGEQGGLYPGGENAPPPAHLKAGLEIAAKLRPLDREGKAAPDGKIVLLSIGFSNPAIEFPGFQQLAARDPDINPHLLTVNGCVGGRASKEQADPDSRYWKEVEPRLGAAGVTALQVQALWIKEVIPRQGISATGYSIPKFLEWGGRPLYSARALA